MSIDANLPWPTYERRTEELVAELVRNGQVFDYSGRAPVTELEARFSDIHDGAYVISFNSGTSALFALLAALGIGDGDDVLVPNLTFLASASPLLWLGANPILVDSHTWEPSIAPEAIERTLTPQTRAVIVTHLFGNPVDMDRISRICASRKILLIEDCSHAHASHIAGRPVGTQGDGAIFSIGAGKMISGGHGGLLVTKDSVVRDLALMIGHFKPRTREGILNAEFQPYAEFALGGNLRLSPIAATLALDHLERLPDLSRDRRRNVEVLNGAFDGLLRAVTVDPPRVNGTYFDVVYRLRCDVPTSTRDVIVSELQAAGVAVTPPATRPLNRVLHGVAAGAMTLKNTYLQRLNAFARTAPLDIDLPCSTDQHDRMLSFPAGHLYRSDLTFAAELVRRARPVLHQSLGSPS